MKFVLGFALELYNFYFCELERSKLRINLRQFSERFQLSKGVFGGSPSPNISHLDLRRQWNQSFSSGGGRCRNNIVDVYHKDDHSGGGVATVNAPFAFEGIWIPIRRPLFEILTLNIARLSHTVDTFSLTALPLLTLSFEAGSCLNMIPSSG